MGGVRKMPEYIERDECRNEFYESVLCILSEDSTNDRANQIIDAFDDLPTADVQPVKHGHWISEYIGYGVTLYRCSVCGVYFGEDMIVDFQHNNFCSDCGARMGGDE